MIIVAPQSLVDGIKRLRQLGGACSAFDELIIIVPNKEELQGVQTPIEKSGIDHKEGGIKWK